MITKVIGEDYPWYPVLGNHDPESPSTMEYLRQYSATVPNIVNRGPEGCEDTTYSFDYGNAHFVVLNVYFNGERDWGLEGEIVPELLTWLEADGSRRRYSSSRSWTSFQTFSGKRVRYGSSHWSRMKRSPSASFRKADGRDTRPFSSIWKSYRPRNPLTVVATSG